jgi:hypothetical protein
VLTELRHKLVVLLIRKDWEVTTLKSVLRIGISRMVK